MAEIHIEISDELKERMKRSNIAMALLIKRLVKHLEEEQEMTDWSVKLQRAGRKGRYDELKRKETLLFKEN